MLFCRQYILQKVFVWFYILMKITAGKVNINFADDKGFTFCSSFLLLLSDQELNEGERVVQCPEH